MRPIRSLTLLALALLTSSLSLANPLMENLAEKVTYQAQNDSPEVAAAMATVLKAGYLQKIVDQYEALKREPSPSPAKPSGPQFDHDPALKPILDRYYAKQDIRWVGACKQAEYDCSAYSVLEALEETEVQFGVEGIAPANRWFGVEVEVGYLLDSNDITAFDQLRVDVVTGEVIYTNGR